MKGSAVTQSFKALASRINNQAPLGPKESNQLLTALTSSFRKHLDEVHPSQPHDEGRRSSLKASSESSNRHGHSSIALAHNHMASVLTNPLLTKGAKPEAPRKPEYHAGTAAAELKNGANPFGLLEAYYAKGHATVDVALTCMKQFRRSIKGLIHEEQVAKVQEEEAGKRVLSWLWNSDVLRSQAYVDNPQIQDGLVWLVMMEGHEDFFWQWLESDLELLQSSRVKGYQKHQTGPFWKSRIVYAMVMTKLGPPHREARSADAALEVYFRAAQLLQHMESMGEREKLDLTTHARLALENALTHGSEHHYSNTSPRLYDKFANMYTNHQVSSSNNSQNSAFDEFHRAKLDLWHPSRPSADIWYEILTREARDGVIALSIQDLMRNPKTKNSTAHYMSLFIRAARLMDFAGKYEESARLVSIAQNYYPDFHVPQSLRHLSTRVPHNKQHERKSDRLQHEDEHQHNWLSQYFPAPT
jgi:hypothetical protein